MRSTLVGVFANRQAAERAREELLRAGFADDEVDLRAGVEPTPGASDTRAHEDQTEDTFGETVSSWFRSLFGTEDEDVGIYAEAMRRGESIVAVNAAEDDRIDRAGDILEACGSVDIDASASAWQLQGWARPSSATPSEGTSDASRATPSSAPLGSTASSAAAMGAASMRSAGEAGRAGIDAISGTSAGRAGAGPAPDAAAGGQDGVAGAAGEEVRAGESRTIPVIEEQLRVGKRVIGRRRMRVYTRMVDEPVEGSVRLTEEHVRIERRDVDRPATADDYRAAQGKSIEVTERSEEPVVAKEARVVGEVEVGKTATDREQTVRDTVRRTDVEVDPLGDAGSSRSGKDDDPRR